LDGNFQIYHKDDLYLSLFSKNQYTQKDAVRSSDNRIQLRVHHSNNKIFSIGVEKWNTFESSHPDLLSLWGVCGHLLADGTQVMGGVGAGYSLGSKSLAYHKYLLGWKHKKCSGYLETSFSHETVTEEHAETKVKTTKDVLKKRVNLFSDSNINDKIKVSGELKIDLDNPKQPEATFASEYKIDDSTTLKKKISTDRSFTTGITHNYKNFVLFNITCRVSLKEGKTEGENPKKFNIPQYKFGVQVDFNDAL